MFNSITFFMNSGRFSRLVYAVCTLISLENMGRCVEADA